MSRIFPTAHFTAQAWIHEGFDNAHYFDTRTGRLLFRPTHWLLSRLGPRAPSLPWHEHFLYIRHYAYEARLAELAPDYVLEIGAGLSARGYTLCQRNSDLVYVEVDLPGVVNLKKQRLGAAPMPAGYVLQPADVLTQDLPDSVAVLPEKEQQVIVIAEGVTDYLTMEQKRRAFVNIAAFLRRAGGGRFLFETYTKDRLAKYPRSTAPVLKLLGWMVGGRFEERLFDDGEAARSFARSAGFDSVEALDVERLNTSRYHPPPDYCHFELNEASIDTGD